MRTDIVIVVMALACFGPVATFAFSLTKSGGLFCDEEQNSLRAKRRSDFDETPTVTRRDVVQLTGSALAAWVIGSNPVRTFAAESTPKTFVITGASSGSLAFEAARQLSEKGHTLVLPCRTLDKSVQTIEKLQAQGISSGTLIPAECNLASLASIKAFAKELQSFLPAGAANVDTVCLNAGVARNTAAKDVARTVDGMELTVGTNHFGHFYLNHLLLPMVKPSGGRIVVTASAVHDPDSPGGAQGEKATLGNLEGLVRDGINFEMVDGNEFNADKAYKDSKVSAGHECEISFTSLCIET